MNQEIKKLTLDPVAMGITNRLAAGSASIGPMRIAGGLLLQGEHRGDLNVSGGPLVIFEGASVSDGTIEVDGDIYVFGRVGSENDATEPTIVRCAGVLHLTSKSVAYGTLQCASPAIYIGAQVRGTVQTIPAAEAAASQE